MTIYWYTTLNDPLGITQYSTRTIAYGINDAGQVVGEYIDNALNTNGFLYSGGSYTTIDDPLAAPIGGDTITIAEGINDAGQIVGIYYAGSYAAAYGFLYSGGNYTTIADPLATGRTYANGINDAGQIVGEYGDVSGTTIHGFLY